MSAAQTVTPRPAELGRFDGGGQLMRLAGAVGVVSLLASVVAMFVGSKEWQERAAHSYLMAFAYWVAIAVATLIFLAIFHTAKAKWVTAVRRPLEVVASSVVALAVLSIPLYLVLDKLYVWTHHGAEELALWGVNEVQAHHLHFKQEGYLNKPFFFVRQAIYWGSWILVSHLLTKWSRNQDAEGGLKDIVKMRKFAPGVLPLLALTITFAAFDWLMSLTPLWQSTIYGVYYFAGGLLSGIAVWILFTVNVFHVGHPGAPVKEDHLHNQGKFLLAFTAFWAYIAFSQFLLVWAANLPEEAPFYSIRMGPAWAPFSIALILLHFVLPFFLLLSRDLKRKPRAIGAVAAYILFAQYVDMLWLVLPNRYPGGLHLVWTDLTALVGVGGITLAYTLWRLRAGAALPVKDPYLPEALRYVQP
ncbi:MAG: hypothetical protein L0Y66_23430 [Myxococcaceae bacterium]|nr:hypothetical protein [Myxococcaceae bacterium]MCI0672197.1 hypothetical protein [Myxococcaceae bacterium]